MTKSIRSRAISGVLSALGSLYALRLSNYPELRTLLNEMRGGEWTGVGISDALSLYEAVLTRKPKYILELGAGQSSAVIALAAKTAGYVPQFIAIEESPKWVEHHKRIIPVRLQSTITLIQRDTSAKLINSVRAAYYVDIPDLPYEFIHVDGPDHFRLDASVSSDPIDLIGRLAPSCQIIFDARENTARLAKPYLEAVGFKSSRHPFSLSYTFTR